MKSARNFFYGLTAQFLNIGFGILIIPIASIKLSPEILGIWFLFFTLQSFVMIFFNSVSDIFPNYFTNFLTKKKLTKELNLNTNKFHVLLKSTSLINLLFTTFILLIFILFAFFYIPLISSQISNQISNIYISIAIFATSTALDGLSMHYVYALRGTGNQKYWYISTIMARITQLMLSIYFLNIGYGLLGLTAAYLISNILKFFLRLAFFRQVEKQLEISFEKYQFIEIIQTIQAYKKTIFKLFATQVSTFFTLRSAPFFISYALSLETSSMYSIAQTIINTLHSVSRVVVQNYQQHFVVALSDIQKKLSILRRSLLFTSTIYFFGAMVSILFLDYFLVFIGSNIKSLPSEFLILMFIFNYFEMISSFSIFYILSYGKVPFMKASLISGCLIIFFQFIAVSTTYNTLLFILLAQYLVQISYNNWRWPLYLIKKSNYGDQSIQ